MKKCPQCGFVPSLSNLQLLKLYKTEFGDMPVMAMIDRGWLDVIDKEDIPSLEQAILKFFEVENEDELWALLKGPPQVKGVDGKIRPAIICNLYDEHGNVRQEQVEAERQ